MMNDRKIRRLSLHLIWIFLLCIICGAAGIFYGGFYYHLSPFEFVRESGKKFLTPVFEHIKFQDSIQKKNISDTYRISSYKKKINSPDICWKEKTKETSLFVTKYQSYDAYNLSTEFVYEDTNAPHLSKFRNKFNVHSLISDSDSEYEAMLKIGAWIGAQWDHGFDDLPGDRYLLELSDVIEAGQNGKKYWCEIAAKITVQIASAMGWPARYVGLSKTGYHFQSQRHAVAELWSNEFNTWFVMDTDFNVVFEHNGVPLSAFELCHRGLELQKNNQIVVRKLGPPKPSLPYSDLIPYFKYIFVDLRNDWYTRRLKKGSPAGGDLATYWTARDSADPILTAMVRNDVSDAFNWKVNWTSICLHSLEEKDKNITLNIGLEGYSPYFDFFQVSVDGEDWKKVHDKYNKVKFTVSEGQHKFRARMVLKNAWSGPAGEIHFDVHPD